MTLKTAVLNMIAPQFAEHGFVLTREESRYYRFEHASTGIQISLTVPPRCPFELLNEYIEALERKRQGDKDVQKAAFVSLEYSVKRSDGGYINLSPYMFESFMGITGGFLYCNNRELEEKASRMVEETVSLVIPFLERLTKRAVGFEHSEDLEAILARDPAALARRAAAKFDLPADRTVGHRMIEPALFALRGSDETSWRPIFVQNLEDIAGFAAYFSECIAARSIRTAWIWETTPEIQTSDGIFPSTRELYFSAYYSSGCKDLRPVQIIQDLWNYCPEIKCRHIPDIMEAMG